MQVVEVFIQTKYLVLEIKTIILYHDTDPASQHRLEYVSIIATGTVRSHYVDVPHLLAPR